MDKTKLETALRQGMGQSVCLGKKTTTEIFETAFFLARVNGVPFGAKIGGVSKQWHPGSRHWGERGGSAIPFFHVS